MQTKSNQGDTTTDDSDGDLISGMLTDNAHKYPVQPSPDTLSRSSSAGEAEFGTFKSRDSSNHKIKPDISVDDSEKPNQANLENENEAIRTLRVTSLESDGMDDVPRPQTKSRLGKIGGRSKPIKPSDAGEHKELHCEPKYNPPQERRKLTTLDAEDKACPSLPSDSELLKKERASLALELSAPQRETSQERADHRRERLKRDLETTAMPPIRKKRKF